MSFENQNQSRNTANNPYLTTALENLALFRQQLRATDTHINREGSSSVDNTDTDIDFK
jgi:hypothetical protein